MSRYRRVRALSPEDAAYIAGIIDGEGTITLTRIHANENRRIVVSIASTELALLSYVQEAIGAGRITNKRTTQAHHSRSWHYGISSTQALELLEQVSPYLRTYKRARADLALRHYRALTPRNGKCPAELLAARGRFEELFLKVRPGSGI